MIALAQARAQIGDPPRWCAAATLREVLAPYTDGVETVFYLRFPGAILSSVRVWTGTTPQSGAPPGWDEIAPGDPTYPWVAALDPNGLPCLTFTHPPRPQQILATRYLMTAFSDDELGMWLTAVNVPGDDARTLKAFHAAMIPRILADKDRLTVFTLGQRREDASAWIAAQEKMRDSLLAELQTEPTAGVAFGFSGQGSPRYLTS